MLSVYFCCLSLEESTGCERKSLQSGGFFGLDSCHQNSVLIRRFCLTPCSGDNLKNVPFAILSVLLIAVMKEKIRSKDTECNTNLASNTSQSIEHVKKKSYT